MKAKYTLFLKLIGSLFALALLAAPSLGTASVIITQVLVTVGGQAFCDTTTACGNPIWNLGGGVTLNTGETLILTQTGTMSAGGVVTGGNFDTSDRGPTLVACSTPTGTPCTVTIQINSGSGLTTVYTDAVGDPLDAFNLEPISSPPSFVFEEAHLWTPAFAGSTYTLNLGYADNEHTDPCPAAGCFPQPVWGTAAATDFIGAGIPPPFGACGPGLVHPDTDNAGNHVGCYDAGALLITGLAQAPEPATLALIGLGLSGLALARRRKRA